MHNLQLVAIFNAENGKFYILWFITILLWFRMVNEFLGILRVLIENYGEIFSIRKLSQKREINYKSAYNAVMRLKSEGLIDLQKVGNAINCSFNRHFNNFVFSVEFERRNELLKNSNFRIIFENLNKIPFTFIVLLFGSYAKKATTKHSDIDLMVISDNNQKIQQTISLFPLKIQLISLTSQEFIAMAKSKEFSVVSEAIKNNIILIGIEDYYRLLENVERSTNQRS